MRNNIFSFIIILTCCCCVGTKSTLKNVNPTAPNPSLSNNIFVLTAFSSDKKYGYEKDYPINVYFQNAAVATKNQERFLNALAGPKGEQISYKKVGICCPFPTTNSEMGVASLDIYEITWEGQKKPIMLYLNGYEKGDLLVPIGFTKKK